MATTRESRSTHQRPLSTDSLTQGGTLTRAAPLWRADWRWLLPERRIGTALCAAGGALRDSVRMAGSTLAEHVDYAPQGGHTSSYDLVIAAAVDPKTLHDARTRLREGGILYVECPARIATRQLVRRFGLSGFEDILIVRAWPSRNNTAAWLPLYPNDRGNKYFLHDHPIAARHPLRRLAQIIRRRTDWPRTLLGGETALCVVALRGMERPARAGTPWWRARPIVGPRDKGWLLLTPSPEPDARVVGLAWTGEQRFPDVATKLARTVSSASRLGCGADVLEHLSRRGFSEGGHAPILLRRLRNEEGAIVATVEEALRGIWLNAAIRKHSLRQLTEELTDWQIRLALRTRSGELTDPWASRFRQTVEGFRAVSDGLVDEQLVEDVEASLRSAGPCPTVVEHHDFRPWNIYRQSTGMMGAFDWDGARIDGLPAFDLIQGHAYLGFALDGSMRSWRFCAGYQRSNKGTLGAVRRACRARYANTLGIADATMRAIRAFAWMELCIEEAKRRASAGTPLTRDALDRSLFSLWEYEARQALA